MERIKLKNSSGITLIALVISIIVMLILAGVSINATVGDNGILSKAQDTVFINSCAYLEEYFNQLYATCSMDGATEGDTPLNTIMNNGYQHYFFSTSQGTCLKKNYTNPETGEAQTLVLYLIKKEQLPEEIQAQLTGGDGLESRDYRKLRGCYGITSDLKAYYCEDGLETILGLTTSDLNADSPDIVFADENSILANVLNGGTAPVTNQSLKTIKRLTIDSTEELSLLSDFSKFTNLSEVYFSGITINSLVGIEGAQTITYIKFTNCDVQDYSAMNGLTELTQLYLVTPAGKDEEIARLGSTDKGIASGEFSKLQYFGIVGFELYLNSSDIRYSTKRYEITDISALANFSDVTKKAIKYMNLQNLQLTSITSLVDFTNIYLIRLEENALTSFDGIQNMSSLRYLIAPNQYSDTTNSYTLGLNEGTEASDTDALKYIYKNNNSNTKLYYVDLRNNTNLKYVDSLAECTGIRYLYLAGCSSLKNASTIGTVLGNCGSNMSIHSAYTLDVISNSSQIVDLSNQTISLETLESLENCTNLWRLNLQSIKLTDASGAVITDIETINTELNETLSKLTKMQHLKLDGISGLSTIDFIDSGKMTLLRELDLRNTNVIDLTNLNSYATHLQNLLLNNANIDLTTIQPTISRFLDGGWTRGNDYWSANMGSGLMLYDQTLYTSLESCTELTKLQCASRTPKNTMLDMSNCKKITQLVGYYPNGLKLSSSVTYHYSWASSSKNLDLSEAISLENLILESFKVGSDSYLSNWVSTSLKNCISLKILKFTAASDIKGFTGFDNLDASIEYPLESFSFINFTTVTDPNEYLDIENLDGLENFKNLKTLVVEKSKLNDISELALCTNLEKVNLSRNYITDITALGSLTKLKELSLDNMAKSLSDISSLANCTELVSLNVNNCSISDVYPLLNCKKLETLQIKNNALTDFAYYKDANGNSVGYEVLDVFYDLNYEKQGSLKKLYMSGNTFDDTEILWDLHWEAGDGGIFQE